MKPIAIDIHTHVEFADTATILKKKYTEEESFSRFIVPATGTRSAEINKGIASSLREPLRDPQRKIRDMEERKVGFSILSSTPFAFFYEVEEGLAVELAQFQNNQLAEMVRSHPSSFAAIATLPLQVPGAAMRELDRAINKLGLRGIEIGSHVGKRELGDRAFWPIYEVLEKEGLPMFIHPHHVAGMDRLQNFYLTNLIGNPLDTTIAAAYLIFNGVLEKYPNLKVVLAHGGGQLPYIFGRLEHGYKVRPECKETLRHSPRQFLKYFYFDIITHSQEALRYLVSLVGSDHVLLGTDYPYDMGDHQPVETVSRLSDMTDSDRQKILRDNAVALFGLTPA
ncbi:MAG: amidohydrolase [Deltaproteobacteria bacterium]|nr:amidohydrolase [Deltaproteobacteria bacterium]